MELRQLRYLVAVADEASFTRAAERLHVAQPGVSAQIRRLEAELGRSLLDRGARTVRPTAVGAAVLQYARAAIAAADAVRRTVDELEGLLRGRVAVGTVTSFSADVPGVLADFHEEHPAVEITLVEQDSATLLDGLHTGGLDVALVSLAGPPPAGIAVELVTDEGFVAAVGPGDALAGRASVALGALRERDLICLPHGTGLRAVLDAACAEAGWQPRVAFEASDPFMLARLAVRGLGVAIVPESVPPGVEGLHALALTRPRLRGQLALAWRADGPSSPAAQALIATARDALALSPARG
jgi:DNA-binding transcriptional LysR family regulator